jgi:uncharacterized membrane protein
MSQKTQGKATQPSSVQLGLLATHYSGPLPTAEQLEYYEKLYSGAAKLFIDKFIEEQTHRHEIEKSESDASIESMNKFYAAKTEENAVKASEKKFSFIGVLSGQILSTLVCIFALALCGYLAINGHTWEAVAVVAIPFAGIIRAMRSGKDK